QALVDFSVGEGFALGGAALGDFRMFGVRAAERGDQPGNNDKRSRGAPDHVAEVSREERACSARMRSARLPLPSSPLVFAGCAITGLPEPFEPAACSGAARIVSIVEPGPSSTDVNRATSAATSLM